MGPLLSLGVIFFGIALAFGKGGAFFDSLIDIPSKFLGRLLSTVCDVVLGASVSVIGKISKIIPDSVKIGTGVVLGAMMLPRTLPLVPAILPSLPGVAGVAGSLLALGAIGKVCQKLFSGIFGDNQQEEHHRPVREHRADHLEARMRHREDADPRIMAQQREHRADLLEARMRHDRGAAADPRIIAQQREYNFWRGRNQARDAGDHHDRAAALQIERDRQLAMDLANER